MRDAAADAARILQLMTGATFSVTTGDGKQGLVVGTADEFPHAELSEALKVNHGFEGREAYAIRTTPGRILVLGASEMGATNGLYRLLTELGCRWLAPTPTWEVIPRQPELSWNRDITDRPQILSRVIWYKTNFDFEADRTPWGTTPAQDLATWGRRNAHLDGLGIRAGHAYGGIIRANKAAFQAHPEYGPLIDGKRQLDLKRPDFNQPDLGNPDVRRIFLDYARSWFSSHPEALMISMEPNDGGGYSQSPEFKKLGTISDAVFGMANEVARMLQREFPGRMVGLYAYREHAEPPSFKLEPNVYVQITTDLATSRSYEEIVDAWTRHHSNLGFYDYYAPYNWHLDQLPGANASSLKYLTTRIRAEAAQPATSISGEASGSWALFTLGYYVANQLMWNTSRDPNALREDFLSAAFGPATPKMRDYYARWDPDNKPIVAKNLLYQMAQDLHEARRLAADRPDVLARLTDLQHYLRFLELDWRLRELPDTLAYAGREAAFIALFRHLHRTRYTYMMHWGLATQTLWQKRAEKTGVVEVIKGQPKKVVNESLLPKTLAPVNPWRDDTPYTPAEIEANFTSTLAFFKSEPLLSATFSTDLVPIQWPEPQPPGALLPTKPTQLTIQGGHARLMLYSATGEPLTIQVRPGTLRQKVQQRPWTLTDAQGKVVAQGAVAPTDSARQRVARKAAPGIGTDDALWRTLTLPVPRAGTYEFDIQDNNGFLYLIVPPEQIAAIRLVPGEIVNLKPPNQPRFFYVPKGTAHIQYYFDYHTPQHQLIGPDGQVYHEGTDNRHTFVKVPVPPGLDGKLWRFDALGIGPLWFT
ncbi:MAG TPA: DUF4838 domain-containing protein, partial [bacterium]|nr:DUF4838 domain-containing protein [bacterium]